jgi:peptidyl-prolyl cis-trans isomerase D
MLQVFRESFGRVITIAILALIAVTFIFWGIDFSITQLSYAAKVNGDAIPIQEFETALQREQNAFQQQNRAELTDEITLDIRRRVLETMVLRKLVLQRAEEGGYRVSDARVEQAIRDTPGFQVDGRYSEDVALSLLRAEGLTPSGYKRIQRDELTLVEFQNAVAGSAFITPAEFRRYIELTFEKREIGYALFSATSFADQVVVDDAAMAAYYAENAARFQTEESVDVEFVVLDLATIAAATEISEDELVSYYESEAERYAGSEERHVRHILIEADDDDREAARAEAARVRERLESGEDFAALAAELSDDAGTRNAGGDLGWYVRGVLGGPLDDALFAMTVGTIEGPVESEFGFHVLRLEEIRAGAQPPFEAIRDQLRADLARERAGSDFYDRATDLAEAALDSDGDLGKVAQDFALTLETMVGLTRAGGSDRFPDPAPFIEQAFDDDNIASGEASDLIELNDNSVAILRVTAHHPSVVRTIEEVSADIRASLIQEGAGERAAAAAAVFLSTIDGAAVAEGTQDPAALAIAQGASWSDRQSVDRGSAQVPAALLSAVFAQARPGTGAVGVTRAPLDNGDEAVVLVFSATPGVPEDIPADERDRGQQQLVNEIGAAEINAYVSGARTNARIRVPDQILNPDL